MYANLTLKARLERFLNENDYGFNIEDLDPDRPGLFRRLREKSEEAYFDFQQWDRDNFSELKEF